LYSFRAFDRTADPTTFGTAVHACLAAYLASPGTRWSDRDVTAILARHGIDKAVAPHDVLTQLATVREWLGKRWPGAKVYVEVPITQSLTNGQILSGRIDLLVESESGWILIDHKAGKQNSSQWQKLAAEYGGQLAAYGAAIEASTRRPVSESWLLLPISGFALKVG
jgi:ATP-dependent exoDNAse (exonuclease V) beta subunit